MKIAVFTLAMVILTKSVSASTCQIAQSVYRDADGKGFELVFDAPLPDTGSSDATATIIHSKQGQLYTFNVTQSSGYGSISLISINATNNSWEDADSFRINFFAQNFKSATPLFLGEEIQAPEYAFIAELGSHDYYTRRGTITENTAPFLGDVMWIHDRCQ